MSSQPIRIEQKTLEALRRESTHRGVPIVQLAQRYIDEGMRMERHPAIAFREGPAGRRAIVIGGPDVWEIVRAARSAPEKGDRLITALSKRLGMSPQRVRAAVAYYADYPEEVNQFIALQDEEAERLQSALAVQRSLIG